MADDESAKVALTIKCPDTAEEVVINVLPQNTLLAIKEQLSSELGLPELLEKGKFVKFLPNGDRAAVTDTMILGTRRLLGLIGARLSPPPEEAPPLSLDDFEGVDDSIPLLSPRSLQACRLDGVLPKELFYAPAELFAEHGVSSRAQRLRHDFFEAFRQDSLAILRATRRIVIAKESATQDVLHWPPSHEFGSSFSRIVDSVGSVSDPLDMAEDEMRITGVAGTWGGALEPKKYLNTFRFFEAMKPYLDPRQVMEGSFPPLQSSLWGSTTARSRASSPSFSRENKSFISDSQADDRTVNKAEREIIGLVKTLKKMPAEKDLPTVDGVARNTEALTVRQRRLKDLALQKRCDEAGQTIKCQAEVARAQRDRVDRHYLEVQKLQRLRDRSFEACQLPPKQQIYEEVCEEKITYALERKAFCLKKKEVIRQKWLKDEETKLEALARLSAHEPVWQNRVAQMRGLCQIHVARKWLDRRIRWAAHEAELEHAYVDKKEHMGKKMEVQEANTQSINFKKLVCAEFKREFKDLRLVMKGIVAEREQRRQEKRRQDVAEELIRLANDRKDKSLDGVLAPLSMVKSHQMFSRSLHSDRSLSGTSRMGSSRCFPRFDWGRFSAEARSPTSTVIESRKPADMMSFSASMPSFRSAIQF